MYDLPAGRHLDIRLTVPMYEYGPRIFVHKYHRTNVGRAGRLYDGTYVRISGEDNLTWVPMYERGGRPTWDVRLRVP